MNAKIQRTHSGTYYIKLEAENTIERIEMTALQEQLRANGNVMTYFGGAAAHCEEVGRSLDTELNVLVRTLEKPAVLPQLKDRKKRHSVFSFLPQW